MQACPAEPAPEAMRCEPGELYDVSEREPVQADR